MSAEQPISLRLLLGFSDSLRIAHIQSPYLETSCVFARRVSEEGKLLTDT